MALRRPRIKVSANLVSSKRRKPDANPGQQEATTVAPESTNDTEEIPTNSAANSYNAYALRRQAEIEVATAEREVADCLMLLKESGGTCRAPFAFVQSNSNDVPFTSAQNVGCADSTTDDSSCAQQESFGRTLAAPEVKTVATVDLHAFKHPPDVAEYNVDGGAMKTAIEEDVIKMDLQKSAGTGAHIRQRIKATPSFGQRRSSNICSASSPQASEDYATPSFDFTTGSKRRDRHYSDSYTSVQPLHFSSNKIAPSCADRVRSESCCGVLSDASSKARKIDECHRRLSRRDCVSRFGASVADKSKLKMFDLIYYNPPSNPIINSAKAGCFKEERKEREKFLSAVKKTSSAATEKPNSNNKTAMPVPQLKLDVNGELVLDECSLEIESTAEQEARNALANSTLLQFDETIGMNGFYKKQDRTKEWDGDETIAFYRGIQCLGTDFSLMTELFPKRTRRDLKLKFKKEERCNPQQINKALMHPKTFQVDDLKKQLDEEERQRNAAKDEEQKLKQAHGKPVRGNRNTATKALPHGDQICEHESILSSNISSTKVATTVKLKPNALVYTKENSNPKHELKNNVTSTVTTSTGKLVPIPIAIPKLVPIAKPNFKKLVREAEIKQENKDMIREEGCQVGEPKADLHPHTVSAQTNDDDAQHQHQHIFQYLHKGKLALVASDNPNGDLKLKYEIYLLNPESGKACSAPLDLPDDLMQSIVKCFG